MTATKEDKKTNCSPVMNTQLNYTYLLFFNCVFVSIVNVFTRPLQIVSESGSDKLRGLVIFSHWLLMAFERGDNQGQTISNSLARLGSTYLAAVLQSFILNRG